MPGREFEDDLVEITFTIGAGGVDAGQYRRVEVRVGDTFPYHRCPPNSF